MCVEKGWDKREILCDALKALDSLLANGEKDVLLLDLPAAYGKSTTTLALAEAAIHGNPHFSRVIHVLPMRSIIEDLYSRLNEWLGEDAKKNLASQYMLQPGSPFFTKKCVITTLDTFLLNFFKLPAHELWKAFKHDTAHFEFPRAMIYSSLIVLDEFHLFSGLGSLGAEYKSLNAVLSAVRGLALSGVPVLVMTATMPETLKEFLREELESRGIGLKEFPYIEGKDPIFDEKMKRKTRLVRKAEGDPADFVEHLNGEKVALILNTVKRAIECYKKLKKKGAILIHGKIPQALRNKYLKQIKDTGKTLVVATQIIEAGIDANFDVMISEACPADRLIQRVGRVARHKESGEIVIVEPENTAPYDTQATSLTWDLLPEAQNLDYFKAKTLINEVYTRLDGPKKIHGLTDSLVRLDTTPILGLEEAKQAFEYFKGFTESSGLVSAFPEKTLEPEMLIPLEDAEAREILNINPKVVVGWRAIKLEDRLPEQEAVSLYMLRQGYRGVVVDMEKYLELTGLDGDELQKSN